ncbi:MAG: HDOD domain-containing protein, partial [Lentisphaeria bacterium]|nr:HDOD domain-containing protein [Lentisphaeria bacterium]
MSKNQAKEKSETAVLEFNDFRPKAGDVIGHFELKKKIGEGGMASVYLAVDKNLSRKVALKLLSFSKIPFGEKHMRDTIEKRFIQEAKSAALVNYSGIAQIYEAMFPRNDNWYIAMEYIDGGTFQDLIDSDEQVSFEKIKEIAHNVATSLNYAWENHKLIHRDIKPQNLMLTKKGEIKIVDLGLAKPLLSEEESLNITIVGAAVGTPYYMAPEQAEGQDNVDLRCDIYALGVTLYELCTGKKPFEGKTHPMIFMAQMQNQYKKISTMREDIPDAFEKLIGQMLEPQPSDRLDSYQVLIDELESMTSGKKEKIQPKKQAPETTKKVDKSPRIKAKQAQLPDTQEIIKNEEKELKKKQKIEKDLTQMTQKAVEKIKKTDDQLFEKEEPKRQAVGSKMNTYISMSEFMIKVKMKNIFPAMNTNVMDLCKLKERKNVRANELTKIIMRDSSLSSNFLSVINSSLYSPNIPIKTVSQAVVLLGFEKVRMLALRLSLFTKDYKNKKNQLLLNLMTSSYFTGAFTMGLLGKSGYPKSEEGFIAGMLSQIPQYIIANIFPSHYLRIRNLVREGKSIDTACRQVLNLNYDLLSKNIISSWQLPDELKKTLLRSTDKKGYLKPFIHEAAILSDMYFGNIKTDKKRLKVVTERLQQLTHKQSLRLSTFIETTCNSDKSINKFFDFTEKNIGETVGLIKTGAVPFNHFIVPNAVS